MRAFATYLVAFGKEQPSSFGISFGGRSRQGIAILLKRNTRTNFSRTNSLKDSAMSLAAFCTLGI